MLRARALSHNPESERVSKYIRVITMQSRLSFSSSAFTFQLAASRRLYTREIEKEETRAQGLFHWPLMRLDCLVVNKALIEISSEDKNDDDVRFDSECEVFSDNRQRQRRLRFYDRKVDATCSL